jgi:hypothetical protein
MSALHITISSGNSSRPFSPFKNGRIAGQKLSNRWDPQCAEQIVYAIYGISGGRWRTSWNYLIAPTTILSAKNSGTTEVVVPLLNGAALAGVSVA